MHIRPCLAALARSVWLALLLASASHALADAGLGVSPASSTHVVGEVFSVDVVIDHASDLYAFQFDLRFDPSVLSATAATEGPFLAGAGASLFVPGAIDNTLGLISFVAGTLTGPVGGQSGNGTLVQLSFQGLAAGTTELVLLNLLLLDSTLALLPSIPGPAAQVQIDAGDPPPVPEPSRSGLLFIGLLALAMRRGTRRMAPVWQRPG